MRRLAKYRVHLRPIVRVCVEIEADGPGEAAQKAYGEHGDGNFTRYAPYSLFPDAAIDQPTWYPRTWEPDRVFVAGFNDEHGDLALVDEWKDGKYDIDAARFYSITTGDLGDTEGEDPIIYS